jgi:hypothetical protein
MHPAGVLAREAIQNSVDAKAKEGDKVSVRFITKALAGSSKAAFVDASGIVQLRPRYAELKLKEPNSLQHLDDKAKPLTLLFIEDRGTSGLEGDPADPESKFYRFLLSLGDGGKEHDEHGTGGSYGYGKSVYSSSSGILTIWAYSRTRDADGSERTLLFGCGYYRKHKAQGTHYTGRAWFGRDQTDPYEHAQQVVEPIVGEEADSWAATLGFNHRVQGDLGTSVLIIDSTLDPKEITKGVEDWWWPRLVEQLLEVEVVHPDGVIEHPRPKKRDDLRPFIEAYQIAVGRDPPTPKKEVRKQFNKLDNTSLGWMGLQVLDRAEDGSYPVTEDRLDAVALIRSTLMVIAYHRQWPTQMPGVVGAYVADDEIDDILRAAEPPAHDRWDSEARRLQEPSGRNRRVVERVLGTIKRTLKQFQASASPPPPPKPKRLSVLERTLASFLAASKGGTIKGPDPTSAPISLTYDHEPRVEAASDGRLRLFAAFSVRLKNEEVAEALDLKVRATCVIVEDGQAGDALPMTISSPADEEADADGWITVELVPQSVLKFQCETAPYDNAWSVRFIPEVQPVEVGQ